jgi:hypothetical protein
MDELIIGIIGTIITGIICGNLLYHKVKQNQELLKENHILRKNLKNEKDCCDEIIKTNFQLARENERLKKKIVPEIDCKDKELTTNIFNDFIYNHDLKLSTKYFDDVGNRFKTFEIRFNNRNYKKNDLILFREYDLKRKEYTGKYFHARITYILTDTEYLQDDYIAFGIDVISFIFFE